ncbi:MAG: vacuolar sorting protein VPS33/slp1 [Watsoniomyces obsoletus]|nr:MAG: vacuolar sorting protein VPS33/slp1 [Watsoniomyces obsoletus]
MRLLSLGALLYILVGVVGAVELNYHQVIAGFLGLFNQWRDEWCMLCMSLCPTKAYQGTTEFISEDEVRQYLQNYELTPPSYCDDTCTDGLRERVGRHISGYQQAAQSSRWKADELLATRVDILNALKYLQTTKPQNQLGCQWKDQRRPTSDGPQPPRRYAGTYLKVSSKRRLVGRVNLRVHITGMEL